MYFKAAILENKNKVSIRYLKKPVKINKGHILVKIFYSSLCHTQLQEISGKRGRDRFLPHCLGHEGVGQIEKVYKDCKKFKVGDFVCLSWVKSENTKTGGFIYEDKSGKKINSGPVHTLNQYSVIDESRIYKLRDKKKIRNKVLLGCALPTVFNIFMENKSMKKSDRICILGGGGLGLSFIMIANQLGYKNLILLDKNKNKLKVIKKSINKIKCYSDLKAIPNTESFDIVIECTGNIDVLKYAPTLTRKFGGKIIVVGNYTKGETINLNPWNIIEGITYQGAWNSDINFKNKFKKLLNIFDKLNTEIFFSKKIYSILQINKAIRDFKNGKVIRPLIKMI